MIHPARIAVVERYANRRVITDSDAKERTRMLSRYPIRFQIGTLVALAALVLVLLGISMAIGNGLSASAEAVAIRADELGRQAGKLETALLNTRRYEKDFLLARKEADVASHAAAMTAARAALDGMEASLDPANLNQPKRIAELRAALATYAGGFAMVAATQREVGLTEKDGLMGDLRGAVHMVEEALGRFDEPRLMVLMLQMRRHEKDYFARIDSKYRDAIDKRQSEFTKALPSSRIPADAQSTISDLMDSYGAKFEAAADGIKELVRVTATLSDQHAIIQSVAEPLAAEARAEADSARLETARLSTLFQRMTTAIMALGGAALLLVGSAIARSIYRPIDAMSATLAALSQGETTITIGGADRGDEIGAMARAALVFRDAMADAESLRRSQEDQRARSEREKVAALQTMAETVERESRLAVDQVAERTRSMAKTAQAMAQSAEIVGGDAQGVASAADQALANAQTVAAASEQLSASITEIAQQVTTATSVTHDAVQSARIAQTTITHLSDAVGRIDEITVLISVIAGQTNLLALNATIEAARAGEAGKGFAVVANEVKNLAAQTSKATAEISTQVEAIQATTRNAVNAVGQIAGSIDAVESIAAAIAAAIEEQGAATGEISRNVSQTSDAANEVSRRIAAVSNEAQTTRLQASQVSIISTEVADAIQTLRDTLIRVVRTSTREVDRRQDERRSIDRGAILSVNGHDHDGRVTDCSRNGATLMLADDAALSPGQRCRLTMDGIAGAIEVEVVAQDQTLAHLHFLAPLMVDVA